MHNRPVCLHSSVTVAEKAIEINRAAPGLGSQWTAPGRSSWKNPFRSGEPGSPGDAATEPLRGRLWMALLVPIAAAGGWASLILWWTGPGGAFLMGAFLLLQGIAFALLLRLLRA